MPGQIEVEQGQSRLGHAANNDVDKIVDYLARNTGTTRCVNIVVQVRSYGKDAVVLRARDFHVPDLSPGEKAKFAISRDRDVEPSAHSVRISTISWSDETGARSTEPNRDVPLEGQETFEKKARWWRGPVILFAFLAFLVGSFKMCTFH